MRNSLLLIGETDGELSGFAIYLGLRSLFELLTESNRGFALDLRGYPFTFFRSVDLVFYALHPNHSYYRVFSLDRKPRNRVLGN